MIDVVTITKPNLRLLPLAPGAGNPIHDLLDAVGLPWRESSAALQSRVGVGDHPIFGTLHGGATTEEQLCDTPAVGYALEYVREPPARTAHLLRRIGHAPERRALIFCAEQLFVIPAADIVGFRADRMQPAKGSGGSSLVVECRRPGQAGDPTTIRFASGPGPDDMNGLCIECGRLFDKPRGALLAVTLYRAIVVIDTTNEATVGGGGALAAGQSSCRVEHRGVGVEVEVCP